jgi:hypothetical protein
MQVNNDAPEGFFQANREAMELSVRRAVQDALREHKAFGNPVATWRDGKVVIVPPEEIVLDDSLHDAGHQNGANGAK